jgi:hypothetical protein
VTFNNRNLSIFFQFSVVKERTEMTPQCLASSVLLENIRKVVVQHLVLIVSQGRQLKHLDRNNRETDTSSSMETGDMR